MSIARGTDRSDEAMPCGDGESGEGGAGEWLASEYVVGETSAIGEEVFQPKKDVNLLGPGDLGVFVIIVGSEGSWSLSVVGRPGGCNDIAR